ncbi:MAG: rhomboid family intramembrane serine protease, partial [Deltaproteobacteria bacterium]
MFPWRTLNPSHSTPWVTWGTMLLCVVVFVFQVVQPPPAQSAIMMAYALVPARITLMFSEGFDAGAVASVFASLFMHGGVLHIVGNMWFLKVFGDNVEDNFGSLRYALFYLLCGVGAAVAQILVDPYSGLPMVGASGAIAGVLAAYLVLYPRARVETVVFVVVFFTFVELPAFVVIAVWFLLQFFSGVLSLGVHSGGGVAYWAHIGGFLSGLVLALLFRRRPPETAT